MYLNLTHDNIGVLSKELKFGVPTSLRHCMLLSDFQKNTCITSTHAPPRGIDLKAIPNQSLQ